jgi:hypothetical protein
LAEGDQIQPASTMKFWAVHIRESSAARNSAMRATSSGCSLSFRHCRRAISASPSASSHSPTCRSVITQPGTIVLTRIRSGPRSRAKLRVRPSTAALQVA